MNRFMVIVFFLNFPQIFIKTQSQVVHDLLRDVLEVFHTVCDLLMIIENS